MEKQKKDEVMNLLVILINDINNEFRANVENKKYTRSIVEHTKKRLVDFEKKFEPYKEDPYFKELADDLTVLNFECWILLLDVDEIFNRLGA